MDVQEFDIPGLRLVTPKAFGDSRGYFMESYNAERYKKDAGIELDFVQDNVSLSERGVLRGLHIQNPKSQGKLVSVLLGEVFDVAVDIRAGSPTFGKWHGVTLSADNRQQFYVPPGFAHGFVVTSETALFTYKCTDFYNPAGEFTVQWDDPAIGIEWPIAQPTLSDKDRQGLLLADVPKERLVPFKI